MLIGLFCLHLMAWLRINCYLFIIFYENLCRLSLSIHLRLAVQYSPHLLQDCSYSQIPLTYLCLLSQLQVQFPLTDLLQIQMWQCNLQVYQFMLQTQINFQLYQYDKNLVNLKSVISLFPVHVKIEVFSSNPDLFGSPFLESALAILHIQLTQHCYIYFSFPKASEL